VRRTSAATIFEKILVRLAPTCCWASRYLLLSPSLIDHRDQQLSHEMGKRHVTAQGGLKIFTTKSQKHQGNKEKMASRMTFHGKKPGCPSLWLEREIAQAEGLEGCCPFPRIFSLEEASTTGRGFSLSNLCAFVPWWLEKTSSERLQRHLLFISNCVQAP